MKRNKTIIEKVKNNYWNKDFLNKVQSDKIDGSEQYWFETCLKFAEICLSNLRNEYSDIVHKASLEEKE